MIWLLSVRHLPEDTDMDNQSQDRIESLLPFEVVRDPNWQRDTSRSGRREYLDDNWIDKECHEKTGNSGLIMTGSSYIRGKINPAR